MKDGVESRPGEALESLTPGARVRGVIVGAPITVVSVSWYGANAVNLTYRDDGGSLGETLLYRDREASLSIDQPSRAYAFDADPDQRRRAGAKRRREPA